MTKKYWLFFCFQWLVFSLIAQSSEPQKRSYFIGANYSYSFPQGILKENIGDFDNLGSIGIPRNSGFTIFGLFQSKRDSWLFMGFDYGLYYLDVEGDLFGDYNLQTTNYYSSLHYKIQAQYNFDEYVKPYVEGLLGVQSYYTRTTRQDFIDEDVYRGRYFETGDLGLSYGGSAGVQVQITEQVFINASASYLKGTPIEYLVRIDNPPFGRAPIDAFEPVTTPTDVIALKVGLQIGRSN